MDQTSVSIEIKDLRKTYNWGKVRALDGVNLTIGKGEVFGLIGPNGAGKTTLMGCLLAALRPSSGSILIDGKPPDDMAVRRITSFLPERPHFDSWMTVRQFLRYHHMLAKLPRQSRAADISNVLARVELDEKAVGDRKIKQLSRGMLQRVGLAQALLGKPKLCFLDEPTSGMDPIGMALVRKLLVEWKKEGTTVILNSHHLDEVERVCDRVAFIKGGKIEALEELSLPAMQRLCLNVRWAAADPPMNEIKEIAARFQVQMQDSDDTLTKFILPNRSAGPQLLRAMILAGYEVEEATLERKNLQEFFIPSDSKSNPGGGTGGAVKS